MIALPRIAGRIFGTPLAIERGKLDVIVAAVGPRLGGGKLSAWQDDDDDDPGGCDRPGYAVTEDGTAVLPIRGTLVSRATGMDAMSGMQSYGQIRAAFEAALADSSAKSILLDIDSPGGEVQGMYDLADAIYQARGRKPIAAMAAPAYSAAYLLASAAGQVMVPRDSGVGSVGIIALHLDESGADEQAGLKYSAIYAGARKNDGNPHGPLTAEARTRLEGLVEQMYGMFVAAVARNRGMTAEAVRGTEALTYTGADGVKAGLADSVGTPEQILGLLATAGAAVRNAPWGSEKVLTGLESAASAAGGKTMEIPNAAEPKIPTAAEIETMIAEARNAGHAEAQVIIDMSVIAGAPQKAAGFLAAKKTAEQVLAELLQEKVAAEQKLNPEMLPGGKDPKAQGKAKPWKEILQVLGYRKQEGK